MATQTGSIDLKAMSAAAKTATNFLSTDSSGIMIYDGKNGAQTPSNPSADTKNVFIDSDSVDVRKGTTVLATFGANGSRIGKIGAGYIETKTNCIEFGDTDGEHMKMGIQYLDDADFPSAYILQSKDPVYVSHEEEYDSSSGLSAIAFSQVDGRVVDTQGNLIAEGIVLTHATDHNNSPSGSAVLTAECKKNSTDFNIASIIVEATPSGTNVTVYAQTLQLVNEHVAFNGVAPVLKQTYSATSLSASAYYLSRTFNIAKTGYTPIAVNARTNQAAVYVASIDFSNPASTSVTVGHRTASSISGLNLYLDVTYVRNELI